MTAPVPRCEPGLEPRVELLWLPLGTAGTALPPERLCVLHRPTGPWRGLVVFAPPLAEEMNKSRRMAALQSRALAAAGYVVLQPDLLGTGDSPGDFGDASWAAWVDETVAACRWLREAAGAEPPPLTLWGLRAGALLAAAAAERLGDVQRLVLWQPATQGKVVLQQFLRLQVAGEMLAGGGTDGDAGADPSAKLSAAPTSPSPKRGGTEALKARLAAGETLEIAGYRLAPALAEGLAAARLAPVAGVQALHWFELQRQPSAALSPAADVALAPWRAAGCAVHAEVVPGPSFWQTTEIEDAPALIEATLRSLQADETARPQHGAVAPVGPVATDAPVRDSAAPGQIPDPTQRTGAEQPLLIHIAGDAAPAVLHRAAGASPTGVVVVVGGPQYRVGSHRQFVQLARHLAEAGHAVLRFDVRGMGDAEGEPRSFEHLSEDIAAAVDALCRHAPAVQRVVLWGLCDGASAALLYLHERHDPRVQGLVLLNPWVRSEATLARTQVKHYYAQRLMQPEFWRKLVRGGVSSHALGEFWQKLRAARAPHRTPSETAAGAGLRTDEPYTARMAKAWLAFDGPLLLALSGRDYTAAEFLEACGVDPNWRSALGRAGVQRVDFAAADHTFSAVQDKLALAEETVHWLRENSMAMARTQAA